MSTVSPVLIKKEIEVWLRNQDILTTTQRGVTTETVTFSGDGSTLVFTFARSTIKNVRSVTVAGVLKTFGIHYTVNYDTQPSNCTLTFTAGNAPPVGTDNVSVPNDYGTTDRIFSDFPEIHLQQSQVPRIAFDLLMGNTQDVDLGGLTTMTEYPVQFNVYDLSPNEVDTLIGTLRAKIIAAKKSFFYFKYITITRMGPTLNSAFGNHKIFQRNQDAEVRFVFES